MTFSVDAEEQQVIDKWFAELQRKLIAEKKAKQDTLCAEGEVYYGAIGGGLTYMFTPTGLGTILVVKESSSGEELNVTAALDWKNFG